MRLFVAMELEQAVRKAMESLQKSLASACPDVRWVRPELMHLTLKFLGEVDDALAVGVTRAAGEVAAATGPFELAVGGCGCFPPRGDVRIVWAGTEEPTGVLAGCVQRLEAALGELGFPAESRAFSPHITIGRVREDHSRGKLRAAVAAARLTPMTQHVASIVVMCSELSRSGPTYTVVSRAAFAKKQ